MSGCLADGVRIVGSMSALRDDGTPVPIVWLAWPEEDEEQAQAFELVRGVHGQIRLVPCDLGKLSDWRKVAAALAAEGGG